MSHDAHTEAQPTQEPGKTSLGLYVALTVTAAITAAAAAHTSLLLTLPTWAMFMG